jgi:hypothetical protein
MEVSGHLHVPAALPPGRGSTSSLDVLEKREIFFPYPIRSQGHPAHGLVAVLTTALRMHKNCLVVGIGKDSVVTVRQ